MSQASDGSASQAFLVRRGDVEKEEEGKSKRGNRHRLLTSITTDQVCFKLQEPPSEGARGLLRRGPREHKA